MSKKIDIDTVHVTYDIAKKVYEGIIKRKEGIEFLVKKQGMNESSASDVLYYLKCFLDGKRMTRTNNAYATRYFLEKIRNDFGQSRFESSLDVLMNNIIYYENSQNVTMHLLREIYTDLSGSNNLTNAENNREQDELEVFYRREKSKSQIMKELENLRETDSTIVLVNHKSYKRDNKAIALIKILRDSKCQICGLSIAMRNGRKYVEAAHITPKHKEGKETIDNIILLCPNHHKEFDYGELQNEIRSSSKYEFVLNGSKYSLDLNLKSSSPVQD